MFLIAPVPYNCFVLLFAGLSLNWLDKTIYWTSASQISLITQGGIRTSTLLSGLDKPRGLQILAIEKYVTELISVIL